jgi:hypothetical protein
MDHKNWQLNLKYPWSLFVILTSTMSLAAIVLFSAGSLLNAIFLIVMVGLFVLSLRYLPNHKINDYYRFSVWVILFAFMLHSWYELLQTPLYEGMTSLTYMYILQMIFVSACADAVISWALFVIATLVRKGRWDWAGTWDWKTTALIISLAFTGQAIGEFFAIRTGRWVYTPMMPTLPIFGIGLTPLLQMPLLIPITLWLAIRATCRCTPIRN